MSSTDRATCWSLTINNPTPSDEEQIAQARQRGWKVDGQLEKGDSGTYHYQLVLRTPQVRFSQVKKAFPRGHIEAARNPDALAQYVAKSETRAGDLPESSELYPSLSKVWDLIFAEIQKEFADPANAPDRYYSLQAFDRYMGRLIIYGYHVETMAVNPQIRSAFLKFGQPLMIRSKVSIDRQTGRQTVLENVAPTVHNHVEEERSEEGSEEGGSSDEESWASDASPF